MDRRFQVDFGYHTVRTKEGANQNDIIRTGGIFSIFDVSSTRLVFFNATTTPPLAVLALALSSCLVLLWSNQAFFQNLLQGVWYGISCLMSPIHVRVWYAVVGATCLAVLCDIPKYFV